MDTTWKDVCLKAMNRKEWNEWAVWCASRSKLNTNKQTEAEMKLLTAGQFSTMH